MKKLLKFVALTFLIIIVWVFIAGINKVRPIFSNSWIFKENQKGPIIGDLGGVAISLPKSFARFVEYEKDPHFLKPRKGKPPERTFQSKFRSFGFEFRFPDMAALTDKTIQDKRQSTIYNTMWMDVGIKIAKYYDSHVMKRRINAIPTKKWGYGQHGYRRLPNTLHGLVPNTLHGLVVNQVYGYDDAKRDLIPANGPMDANIYYHINNKGQINNYIKCRNIRHEATTCSHDFLIKNFKNTMISINYRIGLLPQWQKIQVAVTKLMLNFSVKTNPTLIILEDLCQVLFQAQKYNNLLIMLNQVISIHF